jgi:acetyl-CoA synthetase (ADP-forming)
MPKILDLMESQKFCENHGIGFVEGRLAKDLNDALKYSNQLGFPVVMKVVSEDVVHKTDAEGVRVWIDDNYEVEDAYEKILMSVKKRYPEANVAGMQIQKMQLSGYEIIIGGKRDPQFGPVIMFGLGGIFVEVLKDVSMRICPITKQDAMDMIHEIKGFPMLTGLRGKKAANLDAIADELLKVSNMLVKNDNILELDLNPMFATNKDVIGVDARVILEK